MSRTPLIKSGSFVKEKLLEQKGKILDFSNRLRKSSSDGRTLGHLLTKQESEDMLDLIKVIINHLRCRFELEKRNALPGEDISQKFKLFAASTQQDPHTAGRILADTRTILTIGQTGTKNLVEALRTFTISTLAGVVRLVFQSAEAPLIEINICAEIFVLHENAQKTRKGIQVDELRTALGKSKARSIDILGQLVALLSLDPTGPERLGYTWGPLIFLPRFDGCNKNCSLNKQYEEFDLLRMALMVNSVTTMMISQFVEVFSLDDEELISKNVIQLMEGYAADAAANSSSASLLSRKNSTVTTTTTTTNNNSFVSQQGDIRVYSTKPTTTTDIKLEKCRVSYYFEAENPLEISVMEGEVLQVLEKGDDGWWKVKTSNGKSGLVPENYVEPYDDDEEVAVENEEMIEEEEKQECSKMPPPPAAPIQELNLPVDVDDDENIDAQMAEIEQKMNTLLKLKEEKERKKLDTSYRNDSSYLENENGIMEENKVQDDNYEPINKKSSSMGPPPLPKINKQMPPPAGPKPTMVPTYPTRPKSNNPAPGTPRPDVGKSINEANDSPIKVSDLQKAIAARRTKVEG